MNISIKILICTSLVVIWCKCVNGLDCFYQSTYEESWHIWRVFLWLKDAFAKGEVFLGNTGQGYSASAGLPAGTSCNGAWQQGITIQTPDRCFLFTCETESDQQDWLQHFNRVMSAQMSPQEYTSKETQSCSSHSASVHHLLAFSLAPWKTTTIHWGSHTLVIVVSWTAGNWTCCFCYWENIHLSSKSHLQFYCEGGSGQWPQWETPGSDLRGVPTPT